MGEGGGEGFVGVDTEGEGVRDEGVGKVFQEGPAAGAAGLVEQYVVGREFSVGLLGGRALPPIEIIPEGGFYDYRTKYQAGAAKEVCPADITEAEDKAMRDAAVATYDALHLSSYARVDFILDKFGNPYCLEANTLPGMTPTSLLPQEALAEGMSYADLCEKIIEISLERYAKKIDI